MAADRVYDAVIVGSGAAGGWAAKELCDRGLEVLLLDAGPRAGPPVPRTPRPAAARAAALLRGQRVQLRCAAFDRRTRPFFVSDRDNPYSAPRGAPFNWFRGRQVGGRLHVWARVCLRLSERELGGWPLELEELRPYYREVEDFFGVHTVAPTERERQLGVGEPVPVAEQDPGPLPRTIRAAEASGRLTLRPAGVVRSLTVEDGRARGVSLADGSTARGRAVVLAASTIETLRILLASGIGNSSGRLGRFVMDHVMTGIGGPMPGQGENAEATGLLISRGRFGIQAGIGRGPSWYMLAHGEMAAREENRVTIDERTDRWGVPIARIACAHSAAESALAVEQLHAMRELASTGDLEVRTPPSGRVLDKLAFRLARRRLLLPSGAFIPGSAAHEIGGAAMGSDPATSVTDAYGRLWDAPNVVVADGAVFPRGCWQNVTLTIMALALRACRQLNP